MFMNNYELEKIIIDYNPYTNEKFNWEIIS
jgi:hypothetical protein